MSNQFDRRSFLRLGAIAVVAGARRAHASAPNPFLNARERSLSFHNLHTAENLKTVYWAEGSYIPASLAEIDHHFRDYRTGDVHPIERRLLDLLCELRMKLETTTPFDVISGYRSPQTNAMLHSNSEGVAAHSLHMDGLAADIHIPGRSLQLLHKTALAMKAGGVGYYPASDFVHVDVGRVRTW